MKSKILICALALILAVMATGCGSTDIDKEIKKAVSEAVSELETTEEATEATEAETKSDDNSSNAGTTVKGDNLSITLQYAKQYDGVIEDPNNEYLTAKADDGKVFLVLFCEVENISSENDYINMFYQTGYVDGEKCDQKTILTKPDGYERLNGSLDGGKKMKGCVCYEIKPDWKEFEFTYKDGVTDDAQKYTFNITPGDLS